MKKIIAGLIAGIVMLGVGMLISKGFQFIFPALIIEYANTNLFKPWSDPSTLIIFLAPFILGIILAGIWDLTKTMVKGNNATEKGINFGFVFWIITIPGMLMSFISFPMSITIAVSWMVILLSQALCSGFLFSKILR
jgi:hypothetical protein